MNIYLAPVCAIHTARFITVTHKKNCYENNLGAFKFPLSPNGFVWINRSLIRRTASEKESDIF